MLAAVNAVENADNFWRRNIFLIRPLENGGRVEKKKAFKKISSNYRDRHLILTSSIENERDFAGESNSLEVEILRGFYFRQNPRKRIFVICKNAFGG